MLLLCYSFTTLTLYRYWLGRSWNITFWWTAKLHFPEARNAEGKKSHKGKHNYLGTTDTWYFIRPTWYLLYDMAKMNDFIKLWWCFMTTTKFGNKTRSLHTKNKKTKYELKLDSFNYALSIIFYCYLLCTLLTLCIS